MLSLRIPLCLIVGIVVVIPAAGGLGETSAASDPSKIQTLTLSACGPTTDGDPVVKAFRTSGQVRERLSRLAEKGWNIGCVFKTGIGSVCGGAGCDHRYLVGSRVSTSGVNPQSHSVLALVSQNLFSQKVSPVRLVRIASSDAMIIRDPATMACPHKPGWETTAGMRKCRQQQLRREETQLTRVVTRLKQSFRPMADAGDREKAWSRKQAALFGESQSAWEKYRDTVCAAAYHETFPGSFASQRRLECLFRVTNTRTQELHRLYDFK